MTPDSWEVFQKYDETRNPKSPRIFKFYNMPCLFLGGISNKSFRNIKTLREVQTVVYIPREQFKEGLVNTDVQFMTLEHELYVRNPVVLNMYGDLYQMNLYTLGEFDVEYAKKTFLKFIMAPYVNFVDRMKILGMYKRKS